MADSFAQDVKDALGVYTGGVIPDVVATRLRNSDTAEDILGVLFDAFTSVPEIAGPFILFAAQRLKGRGGVTRLFGEVLEMLPATSRALRLITGKTPADARADLVAHWHRYRSNPSIGALVMSSPAAPAAAPAAASTAPLPGVTVSKIQEVLATGGFTPDQVMVLLYLFRIFRTEGKIGSDIVAELEGEARVGSAGLVETLKYNAQHIKGMLQGADFDRAVAAFGRMRDIERSSGITSTNEQPWRDASADLVRNMMPVIEVILLGYAERHPGSAVADSTLDLMDRLNFFAGLQPSSKFQWVRKMQRAATLSARGFGFAFGVMLLYFLKVVDLAVNNPAGLPDFAYNSTWWMTVLCGAGMIVGAFASTILQVVTLFVTFYLVPIALTVAWVVAGIFAPQVDWRSYWFGLVVVLILDFISFSLLQKGINTVGGIPAFLANLLRDKEQAKAAAEKLAKFNFLSNISSTVAGAVVLLWLALLPSFIADVPSTWRVGGMALVVVAACSYGYLKRGATMKDYHAYAGKLGGVIEGHDIKNLNLGNSFLHWTAGIVVVLFILVGLFGAPRVKRAKDVTVDLADRTVGVAGGAADKVLDWAESKVGDNTGPNPAPTNVVLQPVVVQQLLEPRESGAMMNCEADGMVKASEVRKAKESLGFTGPASMYPWECH